MYKSRLLMTEQPIVINKELAKVIGLNEAIVLQQIEYWININEKAKKESNFKEGYYWTYNTIDQWQEEFPFWSYDTVKRTLKKLERKGMLITATLNNKGYDRTKWYRINYSALDNLANNFNNKSAKCPNEETSHLQEEKFVNPLKINKSAKCPNAIVQNALMEQGKMPSPIPEITTKTSTEISTSSSSKGTQGIFKTFEENICELKKTTFKKFEVVVKQYDNEFLKAIIEECTYTNVKSYRGFEVALKNYVDAKCNNPEEVHQYAKYYSENKKKKSNRASRKVKSENEVFNKLNKKHSVKQLKFDNFDGRDYTEEDYRFVEVQFGSVDIASIDRDKLNICKSDYDKYIKDNNINFNWENNEYNGIKAEQRVITPNHDEKANTEEIKEECNNPVYADLLQVIGK